jgi:hypothetical protein
MPPAARRLLSGATPRLFRSHDQQVHLLASPSSTARPTNSRKAMLRLALRDAHLPSS